jgi:predicted Zn-dependent protease
LAVLAAACGDAELASESLSPLPPDRREYLAFRAQHPELREPNYLPFLVHRLRVGGEGEELLVTCRWPTERFPLSVSIEPPEIEATEDEIRPTPPGVYVQAVKRALTRWEQELGAPIRFREAKEGEEADLRIRLRGEEAPTPEDGKQVLGMTPLAEACIVHGGDPASGALDVRFHGPEVRIYVADEYGLLTPEQVETVATHELGHALGARSHSPLQADLMYEVARDRLGARRLSPDDVNSFAALYALPNGTIYARRKPGESQQRQPAAPAPGPPLLAEEAYEAPGLGFSIRLPEGWSAIPIDHGVAAVDGLAWDYDASLQLLVVSVASIDEYLGRYGEAHLGRGPLLGRKKIEIAGHPALRLAVGVEESDTIEEVTLVETGHGRVLLAIAEVPAESYEAYRPWLHSALDSVAFRAPQPEAKSAVD